MGGDYLTRKEAAAYLTQHGCRISAGRLRNLASSNNKGKGPSFERHGWKSVVYLKSELDRWREARTQKVD